jgi:hypothetical protein
MEDALREIKAGADDAPGTSDDFTDLVATFVGPYAYTYTYDGQVGSLDHALANMSLTPHVTGATVWHINVDESDVFDYDTSFKPPAQEALYEEDPYRSADHDAIVVGLSLPFAWSGFFPPVANRPALNWVKAGSAIAVKFGLGGDRGLGIFAAGYPLSQRVSCETGTPIGSEEPTATAGGKWLSYDAATKQYIYPWRTEKNWAGTCRELVIVLTDGTTHQARFQFAK